MKMIEQFGGRIFTRGKVIGKPKAAKDKWIRDEQVGMLVTLAPPALDRDLHFDAQYLSFAGNTALMFLSHLARPDVSEVGVGRVPVLLHWPIPDGRLDPKTAEFALALAHFAAGWARVDRKVVFSCNAGRNRSCLLAALAYRWASGCTGGEAVEYVQARRPRALANEHFTDFLAGLGAPPSLPQKGSSR